MPPISWTGDPAARMPIGQILAALAEAAPNRPLVTCHGARTTRLQLDLASNRLARAYEALGVRPGSFVAIALPNGIEFFRAAFAVWKLGAVPLPLSYALPDAERVAIVELADCALVVGAVSASHPTRACVPAGFRPDRALSCEPITPPRVAPSWKAPTSGGSTGRPKIIVAGQDGYIDPGLGRRYGMVPDGVVLIPGPLYHNAPFTHAMLGAFLGNHIVVLERFHPAASLRAIGDYGVQWVSLVPTMMLRIWREMQSDPGAYDLHSLRQVWHMAAPCPAWLKDAWIELVGADALMELFGGTEGQATTVISGAEWLQRRGSVGKPVFGHVRILDEDGQPVPAGVTGEIYMRWNEDARPPYRYIGAEPRSRDGWESLGDLGWLDADGYLYIADRRTDMILSGGANIYPAEVEGALLAHPAVRSCVVVGLPDEDLGQRVHALVEARAELGEDLLREFLSARIARYKIPRSFRFMSETLRDDAGKVRRGAWRDQEIARLRL
jgi:bile acid-coenzyme A ligase